MTTSQQLLGDYRTNGSETAFRELVERYTGLVYSTALRLVAGDTHLAEDIAQTVFIDLARKARRLPAETMLGGWLYRNTCFVAAKARRGERRRQAWEREAVELNAQEDHAEAHFAQIAPFLDEAMNQLGPEDQSAVVMRFFERLDFSSLGEALGSTEEAARKRVNRALDKLHALLTARGVTLSVAALGAALAARAVEAAPAEVVAGLANTVLIGRAAGHGTSLTPLKGVITSKAGLSVASAVLLAGAGWLAWSWWGSWWQAKPPPLALNGTWTRLDMPELLGHIKGLRALMVGPEGEVYVADEEGGGRIQKRDRNGHWSMVASVEQSPNDPIEKVDAMVWDASGALYVAQYRGIRWGLISRRDQQGIWSSLAMPGERLATMIDPRTLIGDQKGNLYVCGWVRESGCCILLRKPDGEWVRLAGPGDALGEIKEWSQLALDFNGNLYVSDTEACRIQKRDANGHWSLVELDPLFSETLERPGRIAVDTAGTLYICDWSRETNRLLKRDVDAHCNEITLPAQAPGQIGLAALSVDSLGNLYAALSESDSLRILRRDLNGTWTLVSEGSKEPGFLSQCSRHLAVDTHGNLYVPNPTRRQIQKRDPEGRWSVVCDALPGESWNEIPFSVDQADNLYVVDKSSSRVMTRDSHGMWEIGMDVGTELGQTQRPSLLYVDASENLYLIDGPTLGRQGHPISRLQKRDRDGRWTVLVDAGTELGRELGLGELDAVAAVPNGDVFIADSQNDGSSQIRIRDSKGRWKTLATNGRELGQVARVTALATDSFGRLYVADIDNARLQVRDVDGRWMVLSQFPPNSSMPCGVAVDNRGGVYITGCHGATVLRWTPPANSKAQGRR
jgi:RNA polymerase sigma factor (sigma-70 family)